MALLRPNLLLPFPPSTSHLPKPLPLLPIRCAKRTGKRRYPSEKKKLQRATKTLIPEDVEPKEDGFWRIYKLGVNVSDDPGKDFYGVSMPLLQALAKVLEFPVMMARVR